MNRWLNEVLGNTTTDIFGERQVTLKNISFHMNGKKLRRNTHQEKYKSNKDNWEIQDKCQANPSNDKTFWLPAIKMFYHSYRNGKSFIEVLKHEWQEIRGESKKINWIVFMKRKKVIIALKKKRNSWILLFEMFSKALDKYEMVIEGLRVAALLDQRL